MVETLQSGIPEEPPASHPILPPGPPANWVTPPSLGEVIISEATGNIYTMGEKIGEGYFGLVFNCVDVWNNNLAAKVMKPVGPYEKIKQSAEAELNKLLILRHPHVTYVYDAFEFRGTFYIITELCYGPVKKTIRS
jgi:serine/threonine-protein kinase